MVQFLLILICERIFFPTYIYIYKLLYIYILCNVGMPLDTPVFEENIHYELCSKIVIYSLPTRPKKMEIEFFD